MKFRDRSGSLMPDFTVLAPLFVLFIISLSGPNLGEALHRSQMLFTHGWTALALWSQVVLLAGHLHCVPRGSIEVKGTGPMEMFWLEP
jgi:hypothetical protein